MKKFLSKSLVGALVVAGTLSSAMAGEKWNLAAAYSDTNYHTQNLKRFAAAVNHAVSDQLTITVHSAGSLFKGGEIKRAVQTGQTAIGERFMSAHSNDLALLATDSLPFVATSFEKSALLWQAAKPIIDEKLADQNLKVLYSVPWPPQGFYANKHVKKIGDFAGMKMRAPNPVSQNVAKAVKAMPMQIEAAELTQALATGVVNSFISSNATGVDKKVWETLGHYNDFGAWVPRNYVIVNLKKWNALPADVRKTVEAIAGVTEHAAYQEARILTSKHTATLRANGMSVNSINDKLRADLVARTQFIVDDYLKQTGAEGKKILAEYKKLVAKAGLK